jgi:cytochrome c1
MTRKDSAKLLVAVTGVLVFAAAALFAATDRADPGTSADGPASAADRTGGSASDGAAGPARGGEAAARPPAERGAAVDTPPPAADTVLAARGREVFRSVGCTGCHSAEGVGRDRLPLDGVGSRLSADTLRAWVVDPRSVDPSARKPAYDDLPEEDVDALVAYMESLTEE